jgi:hypothetical protein
MNRDRAWIRLSRRRLGLLDSDPWVWTDQDLAIGLSRTYRRAGYSAWDLPRSVALRSLTVLTLCRASPGPDLSDVDVRHELLHDAVEPLMGWDPTTPLIPHLGREFARRMAPLQFTADARYALPAWAAESLARHMHADRLSAASEAHHVAAWSRSALRSDLGITQQPLATDPLPPPAGLRPWESRAPKIAEQRFLSALQAVLLPATPSPRPPGDDARSTVPFRAATAGGQ